MTEKIVVEVPAPEPESTPEAAPVVVVADGGDDGGAVDAALITDVIETHDELAELRADNERLSRENAELTAAAEAAATAALVAAQASAETSEQVAELIESQEEHPSPEDDTKPNREHWFWA